MTLAQRIFTVICSPQANPAPSFIPWIPNCSHLQGGEEQSLTLKGDRVCTRPMQSGLSLISSARTNSYIDCIDLDISLHKSSPWTPLPAFIGITEDLSLAEGSSEWLLPATWHTIIAMCFSKRQSLLWEEPGKVRDHKILVLILVHYSHFPSKS